MRQVNLDELIDILQASMRKITKSQFKGLQHHSADERLRARVTVATMMAADFKRLEILSSAPPGPPIRYGALDGGSGVPPIKDPSDQS
jgi:hypothetical protein